MNKQPPPLPPLTPLRQPPQETTTHLLEINLISAQNLKPPSAKLRRLQTYAVAYVDSNYKLRTRIDGVGAENPTWNDKFLFRVTDEFLSSATSAVTVDIYAVGVLSDVLLGSVRFLISNILESSATGVTAFAAVQIRRSSGRFHGVLNLGAMVINASEINSSLSSVSAIGYVDMMGEGRHHHRRRKSHRRGVSDASSGGSGSWGGDSVDYSDGTESTGSNSSSTTTSSSSYKFEGGESCEGGGRILCGLGFQRKVHFSPSQEDLKAFEALDVGSG